jgi:dienelactone hydrolase
MTTRTSTARFLWRFAHTGQDLGHEREILIGTGGETRSATVFAPSGWPRGRPGWVLLHGITVPGRHHDALRRMARSLAAAGHYAIAPEVSAWRDLKVDPGETLPAVLAGLDGLAGQTGADRRRIGLIGFSVAGRWAFSVAAHEQARLKAVAAMGGYWDIERTLRAMVAGEHEWESQQYRYDPDPYGRWIMGANLLPMLHGDEFGSPLDRAQAGEALHLLVRTAGQNGAMARTTVYDALNASLRDRLPSGSWPVWDLLAPLSFARVADRAAARELATQMARAAVERYPLLASTAGLDDLRLPLLLLHGRADRLIPFTETLRLAQHLPQQEVRRVTVTRLFGHTRSREARPPRDPVARARELAEFAATVRSLLGAVEE